LINTGWTGGSYGTGERISLKYTRAMITAALAGELDEISYTKHPIFGLDMPQTCPNVPAELLNPVNTWKVKEDYETIAIKLAAAFSKNFEIYKDFANEEIISGGPVSNVIA